GGLSGGKNEGGVGGGEGGPPHHHVAAADRARARHVLRQRLAWLLRQQLARLLRQRLAWLLRQGLARPPLPVLRARLFRRQLEPVFGKACPRARPEGSCSQEKSRHAPGHHTPATTGCPRSHRAPRPLTMRPPPR